MSSIEHHVNGVEYWRSLEQLADTPEVRDVISKEFPGYDADGMVNSSRRSFLKLMGASMALSGLTLSGCRRWPQEKLAPFSSNPRNRIPGVPEQYATVWEMGGVGQGLLVTSFDGRPIKIEGNPLHPFSWTVKEKIGAAAGFAQASILEMYDPQRSRGVVDRRNKDEAKEVTWAAFAAATEKTFADLRTKGDGFAILSEATSSPSVEPFKKMAAFPGAKWYEYEPLTNDAELEGSRIAFGKALRPRLNLEKASVIVLLDADILSSHPAHVRYAADWSERRRSADQGEMSRMYIAESSFSITGTVADARLGVDPSRLYPIIGAIGAKFGVGGVPEQKLSDAEKRFVESAAADLKKAGANGVLAAGYSATPIVHALVHAINQQIGATGNTVTLLEDPAGDRPTHMQAIVDLCNEIKAGKVTTLLILGGNPGYDAPLDVEFAKCLAKVPTVIRLGTYEDETTKLAHWHLPRAHYLESWGDARAWDGTPSITQPLIEPLFGGKSVIEVLAMISGDKVKDGYDIVRRTWDKSEIEFRKILHDGLQSDAGYKAAEATLKTFKMSVPDEVATTGMTLCFQPDSRIYDGRFANNGWLQETPDSLTKLVWDNAALLSKKDADGLKVDTGDMVLLEVAGGKSLEVAVYILPGQPLGVIGLSLGYGRTAAGNIGDNLGFNAYALRMSKTPYVVGGVKVTKTANSYLLVGSQLHHIIDDIGTSGRDERIGEKNKSGRIIHETTFAEYKENPRAADGETKKLGLQLFDAPMQFNTPHAWGMSIDMNACIGCNACAVACQAENNIPIVGKVQAKNHREMNWIRIDRYFKGTADDPNPQVVYQPVTCMHCENAPCEQVCPVAATMHDSEGLNTMVYNRCIGTRYCSNNCPYKVRRFNYFDFHSQDPRGSRWAKPWNGMPDTQQNESIDKIKRMVFNPGVTIRMRGVMEKCTYCVQRIHTVTIAKRAKREEVVDGDIVVACQQACPTQAIVFGNLNDPAAKVTQLHKNARAYGLLDELLNTRPRTRYLAKLRNPAESAGSKEAAGVAASSEVNG